jgi:hypothetical protein
MEERNKRKKRMQELLQKNKESRKLEIEPLLKECVEVLQSNVEILSQVESEEMYYALQKAFPFTSSGRIEWDNFRNKIKVANLQDIIGILSEKYKARDYDIVTLWGYGNSPVIRTNLQNAIKHIEAINAIGSDQWAYCHLYKFVIEFYHDDSIVIGFHN